MLDRIMYINEDEVVLIYTNRPPLRLYAKGDIVNFVSWFLSPNVVIRLDEYRKAMALSNEDTTELELVNE